MTEGEVCRFVLVEFHMESEVTGKDEVASKADQIANGIRYALIDDADEQAVHTILNADSHDSGKAEPYYLAVPPFSLRAHRL